MAITHKPFIGPWQSVRAKFAWPVVNQYASHARVSTYFAEQWTSGKASTQASTVSIEQWTGGPPPNVRASTVAVEQWVDSAVRFAGEDPIGRTTPSLFSPRDKPIWPIERAKPAYTDPLKGRVTQAFVEAVTAGAPASRASQVF